MAIMPGASRVQKFSGNSHRAAVTKIVLHTTEGSSWPGYGGGGSAPHFTVHRDGTIRQHIDTSRSSKALVNKSGGVQTNNAGAIQIEFIGSCDKAYAKKHGLFFTENATDKDLAGLAKVLAWISKTHGVPLTASGLNWPTSNAAYAGAPQRMSFSKWNSYKGVCGHTHVPENDHWDPGNFPITRLLALARGTSAPVASGGASKPAVQNGKLTEDGRLGTATVKVLQKRLGVTQDGRAGEDTWKALQKLLGTVVDGAVSHQSYRATELGNGVVPRAWRFTGRGSKGSKMVVALQKKVGVTADGVWYEGTTKALQKALNAGTFRAVSSPSGGASAPAKPAVSRNVWETSPRIKAMSKADAKAIQTLLVGAGYSVGKSGIDGSYKGDTVAAAKAAQKALKLTVDGVAGPDTVAALKKAQKAASKPAAKPASKPASKGIAPLVVDGKLGKKSAIALQLFLNSRGANLKVDGKIGSKTWEALQHYLKAPFKDGKISRQSHKASKIGDAITQGWEYTGPNSKGSQSIRLLQKWVGVKADGIVGPDTVKALQRKLNEHKVGYAG